MSTNFDAMTAKGFMAIVMDKVARMTGAIPWQKLARSKQEALASAFLNTCVDFDVRHSASTGELTDTNVVTSAKPAIKGNIDRDSFNAGVECLKTRLMEMKYDALKEGRLDLERFDIRTVDVRVP